MLFRDMSVRELHGILEAHSGVSSHPLDTSADCLKRIRRMAKQSGLWNTLTNSFDADTDIPVIKRSVFRNYKRNGNRTHHQNEESARGARLQHAFYAAWLEHPKGNIDAVQDLLWAYCDDWTWVMAAHEYCAIDLGAVGRAYQFSEILHLLGDRIEEEVRERVRGEIERRILKPISDPATQDWWQTGKNNWNHVCNGKIIETVMLHYGDNQIGLQANLIHRLVQNMTYALDGFTDDGGCVEGPTYWQYGFGSFLQAAYALYLRTGGEVNICSEPKIESIARYPLAADVAAPLRAPFSDTGSGYLSPDVVLLINQFFDASELFALCQRDKKGCLALSSLRDFALDDGKPKKVEAPGGDSILPDLGQIRLRGKAGNEQITMMAISGNNGISHNHNDVGSFIVCRNGVCWLDDCGAPTYEAKTFGPQRYEILFCRSFGHGVPLINGQEQEAGTDHFGTLSWDNLHGKGDKSAMIDMTRAYPRGTVSKLVRTLNINYAANALLLEDQYHFTKEPASVEEAFVTFEKAVVLKKGQAVRIGPVGKGVLMTTELAGQFSVTVLTEESKAGQSKRSVVRISFTPKKLSRAMTLRFRIE